MRKNPTVPTIDRELNPDKISGAKNGKCPYKQAKLNIDLNNLAQSADIVGKNPKEFSLDRPYLKGITSIRDLPFIPFGHGPHQCPAWWLYQTMAEHVVEMLAEREAQIQAT